MSFISKVEKYFLNIDLLLEYLWFFKYIKHIKIVLRIFSLFSLFIFFTPWSYKDFWSFAWGLLVFIMFLRPISDIFHKVRSFKTILTLRRELWIIVWCFAIAHFVWYFIYESLWFSNIFDSQFWDFRGYLWWWSLALLVAFPLLFTSNNFSVNKLWKYWKTLQRLAYFMFFFTAIHIFLIHPFRDFWPILIFCFYIFVFISAYFVKKKRLSNSTSKKYICKVCLYIYDEDEWDPDSWIAPWTKFEDIPDDWYCPVCWVSKKDFVELSLYKESKKYKARVVEAKYVNENKDVLSLVVELKKELKLDAWQFFSFFFKDKNSEFKRTYSVVEKKWNTYSFLIKIWKNSRWWKILSSLKKWDKIYTDWAHWDFVLSKNDNNKVFICSGTGLAPIYNMLNSLDEKVVKKLYFWVSSFKDLFFIKELKKIKNLEINVFLSREDIKSYSKDAVNYNSWRIEVWNFIDNSSIKRDDDVYICWNPNLVEDCYSKLKEKWFKNIFKEKFT